MKRVFITRKEEIYDEKKKNDCCGNTYNDVVSRDYGMRVLIIRQEGKQRRCRHYGRYVGLV